MDSKFLEFWGNYLLAAARGQKQLEDLNQWIDQGFKGFEDLTAMFNKFYGITPSRKKDDETTRAWQSAAADFRNSFDAYIELMGLVSKDKYQALEEKFDALQKKAAEQEESIQILRKLLAEDGTYQGETIKAFQDLMNKQADAFETLMNQIAAAAEDEGKE